MKRKAIGAMAALLAVVFATGCGNAIPELNDRQQDLVVEYAAGVLLKYDKNHESRLVELTLEQEEAAQNLDAGEEMPKDPAPEENADTADQEESISDVTVIDNTQEMAGVDLSIESFLKLDSVAITYNGCEIDDFYPQQGDELYFVMNATKGHKLLVLKFLAQNTSEMETAIDIAQSETRFKVAVNGEEKNALTTMLLNDMPYYQGMLAPGESTELVLVCEIPAGQAEMISSLKLILKRAGMSETSGEQNETVSSLEINLESVDDIATISSN